MSDGGFSAWGPPEDRQREQPRSRPIPPLKIVEPINWQNQPVPPREWIVSDWIPRGAVTGLYGDGGLGKSLLAQQLLTCVALGKPWLGKPTKGVRALGVFCEDSEEELQRRQADINRLYGCDMADLADMRVLPRLGADNLFMTFDGGRGIRTTFAEQVTAEAKDFGAELIVLDTVADTFGGSENDRGQVRQYVQAALGYLAQEIKGAVLALAHPSRTGLNSGEGDGGSTGWNNAFRSRLFLHQPAAEDDAAPDANARVLTRKKANYAARHDAINLRWCDGAFVTDDEPTGIIGAIERRGAERVFLELLDAAMAQGRALSASATSGNFAPRAFAKSPDRAGYTKADFVRAMEQLFAERKIRLADYGRPGDERKKIVREPEAPNDE